MKLKFLLLLLLAMFIAPSVFASTTQNAVEFFKQYQNYANNYTAVGRQRWTFEGRVL